MMKGKETGGIDAFLGKNTTFNGTLIFDGLVRMDGNFEGNIKTKDTLVVANSGNIKADVEAGVVKVSGKFDGSITAKDKVELYKPAVVTGTIRTPAIKMEEGVVFNGNLEMGGNIKTVSTPAKEEKE
ncbi:bactofilin family protein [Limisalsivibrio acetivorans]|uniref:bactofilin family protein n=1 Tax=Limisalsivibrio acetivorans TaxID=1304888 RepID=UPI0003B65C29|nr:polymer-forming cytoskeletal protein [Limisalsivibrio acetivorans]